MEQFAEWELASSSLIILRNKENRKMETDFAFISKQEENIEKSAAIFFIDVAIYLMFIFSLEQSFSTLIAPCCKNHSPDSISIIQAYSAKLSNYKQ